MWRFILKPQLTNIDADYYIVDGKEVPRVSTILKSAGIIPWYYSKNSANKGRRKHKIFEAYLKKNLDYTKINSEEMDLLEVFQSFLDKHVLQIFGIEERAYNAVHNIAGTIDLHCQNKKAKHCIVDYKTGQKERWHSLQLAAYFHLLPCTEAYILYITPKKYDLIPVEKIDANFEVFLDALNIHKWKHAV